MAVAADDRHAGLSESQFRPDDVDNSLLRRIHVEQANAKLFAVALERGDLLSGNQVGDRRAAGLGGNVVIDSGHCARRLAHLASRRAQAIKRLGRSHFVNEVQVDVEDRRPSSRSRDQMSVPDLLE